MTVDINDKAPDFTAPRDGGGSISTDELKGTPFVLYFYPKDSTPGCTTEGIDFRDNYEEFKKLGIEIFGVSKDSVKRHDNFKAKYEFPFTLISDEDGSICEKYGVWVLKKNYGREYMGIERSTFLIDANGKIRHIWRKVKVKGHVSDVLEKAKSLALTQAA